MKLRRALRVFASKVLRVSPSHPSGAAGMVFVGAEPTCSVQPASPGFSEISVDFYLFLCYNTCNSNDEKE